MTPEENNIAEQLKPKEPSYEDYLRQYEQMPAFDYNAFRNNWEAGKKPMMDALMSAYTKPIPRLTPEQEKRARNAAAISDAFTSLAEIFAHSQGANIRNRSTQSAQRTTNDRLRQIQDKYEQDLLRYNTMRRNAEMQDFQQQLKAAMEADNQKRKNILLRAEYAKQLEDYARKAAADEAKYQRDRQDKLDAEDRKYQRDKELIRERARYRSSGGGGRGGDVSSKNIFEIPVEPGTQGSEFDDYTGKSYIKQHIPQERQATILSNLPGGKQQYIVKNRLYKTYSYTDDFGKLREQVTPFSDAEIIKYYLENDYMKRRHPQPQQPVQQPTAPSWKIPSQNTWNPSGTQQGQPKFNHSPY